MNIKIPLFLLLFQTISFGCNVSDCNSIAFRQQNFADESKAFQVYNTQEKIIFKDEDGTEYPFTKATELITEDREYLSIFECRNTEKAVSYQGAHVLIRYEYENDVIAFVHSIEFLEEEEDFVKENLVDAINLSTFRKNTTTFSETLQDQITYFTSARDGNIDIESINNSALFMLSTITLNGKVFDNVFEAFGGNNQVYYQKDNGLIAFYNNENKLLTFDRFE